MFERKKEYPYDVQRRPGGYLQVIYELDHPSSALHLASGEYAGQFVCAQCGSLCSGLYRHGEKWKCPPCKDADTPKKAKRVKKVNRAPLLANAEGL